MGWFTAPVPKNPCPICQRGTQHATCRACGRKVCVNCIQYVNETNLCKECIAAGVTSAAPQYAPRTAPVGSVSAQPDNSIRCPRCTSNQVQAFKKGFGLGKAAVGAVALGPVGLLGGLVGANKVELVCLKCGNRWQPGK